MGGPEPFGDREEVKKAILLGMCTGASFTFFSLVFAALGVIGDALNIALGLEPMTWLLLAIFTGVLAIPSFMHSLTAKHLYGIEPERKKE